MSSAISNNWPIERDLTEALACLLKNSALRERLATDALALADELRVRPADRAAFLALSLEELEAQARTLVSKRFHDASKLLPVTMERLAGEAWRHFWRYAEGHWPTGHRRHLEDALRFLDYLACQQVSGLASEELYRLRFLCSGRRLAAHSMRAMAIHGKLRAALQILVRWRTGRVGEYAIYLDL